MTKIARLPANVTGVPSPEIALAVAWVLSRVPTTTTLARLHAEAAGLGGQRDA